MDLEANDLIALVRKLSAAERRRLADLAAAMVDEEPESPIPAGPSAQSKDYANMSFKDFLLAMPDVGDDSIFARDPDLPRDDVQWGS